MSTKCQKDRSQWPRGLRRGSTVSRRGHGCLSLVSVVYCQVEVSETVQSLVQRSPTECGRGLHEASLHATRHRVQSPASERAGSKLAKPITCRNEKAGQSASSASVHLSTSRR